MVILFCFKFILILNVLKDWMGVNKWERSSGLKLRFVFVKIIFRVCVIYIYISIILLIFVIKI